METKERKWHTVEPGIRFRTEEGRKGKNNIGPDKYYSIRYRVAGKLREEALGWESEGWTLSKVRATLYRLKENQRTGQGEQTLEESRARKRAEEEAKAEAERQRQEEARRAEALIYNRVFENFVAGNDHLKDLPNMKSLHKNWIAPTIGDKRLDEILLADLEGIREQMEQAGKAPRTIQAVKAHISRVYSFAGKHGLFLGGTPTRHFAVKVNNKRDRYLTEDEARLLLDELNKVSQSTYRMAFVSLNSGMRFGEIAALKWGHVHLDEGWLNVVDAKNGESRKIPLTPDLSALFREMRAELQASGRRAEAEAEALLFPSRSAGAGPNTKRGAVSKTFERTVAKLGLNEGRNDRRFKVVFHSLRHTAASWMVNRGIPITTIQKILGHKTLAMTTRYSHVGDRAMQEAIAVLGGKTKAIQSD